MIPVAEAAVDSNKFALHKHFCFSLLAIALIMSSAGSKGFAPKGSHGVAGRPGGAAQKGSGKDKGKGKQASKTGRPEGAAQQGKGKAPVPKQTVHVASCIIWQAGRRCTEHS